MSGWIVNPNVVSTDAALRFDSWNELHSWFDSCDPDGTGYRGNSCPFIEALFVIGCYQLYRDEELLESVSETYGDTDEIAGKPFKIVGEIPLDNENYDIENLPMWECVIDDEIYTLFPEELFVKY